MCVCVDTPERVSHSASGGSLHRVGLASGCLGPWVCVLPGHRCVRGTEEFCHQTRNLTCQGGKGLRWGLWRTAPDLPVAGLHRQVQLSIVVGNRAEGGGWGASEVLLFYKKSQECKA